MVVLRVQDHTTTRGAEETTEAPSTELSLTTHRQNPLSTLLWAADLILGASDVCSFPPSTARAALAEVQGHIRTLMKGKPAVK